MVDEMGFTMVYHIICVFSWICNLSYLDNFSCGRIFISPSYGDNQQFEGCLLSYNYSLLVIFPLNIWANFTIIPKPQNDGDTKQ